jgi:hypothetical protein
MDIGDVAERLCPSVARAVERYARSLARGDSWRGAIRAALAARGFGDGVGDAPHWRRGDSGTGDAPHWRRGDSERGVRRGRDDRKVARWSRDVAGHGGASGVATWRVGGVATWRVEGVATWRVGEGGVP